jgi:amicyanin
MKKQSMVVIGLLALLVIGVVIVLVLNGKEGKDSKDSMKMPSGSPTAPAQDSSSASATPAPSDAVEATAVTLQDYAFGPKDIKVKVGTTVTWTNQDDVHHSVTADKASADAPKSDLFGKGETYSFTFKKAGVYSYHCEPHPYMKGTVTVTE